MLKRFLFICFAGLHNREVNGNNLENNAKFPTKKRVLLRIYLVIGG